MGDKIKPNWGVDAGIGVLIPSFSEQFTKEIAAITSQKEYKSFLNILENTLSIYISRKAEKNIRPKPTPKRVEQAAIEIKKTANDLHKMLYGSAGGVQPFLEYPLYKSFNEPGTTFFLEEFRVLLKAIETGCDDCLESINYTSNSPRIKELAALEIMLAYEEALSKKASTTLSLERGDLSEYAKILKSFLKEADNFTPSNGDIKKLMSWAKNNKDFYIKQQNEYKEYFDSDLD